jgi:insertion element IS1 protein InsB
MNYGVWSNTPRFVGKKRTKKEVWLALDRKTSELKKRFHVGGRSREDARKFWQSLPPVYRQCAVVDGVLLHPSDKWEARNNTEQAA